MTHSMNLDAQWFRKIAAGTKTIELRLFDEKRRQIQVGDTIVFTDMTSGETVRTLVRKLHRFSCFEELYANLPLVKCGYAAEEAAQARASDMEAYYSVEAQAHWGVVGIEIVRL